MEVPAGVYLFRYNSNEIEEHKLSHRYMKQISIDYISLTGIEYATFEGFRIFARVTKVGRVC